MSRYWSGVQRILVLLALALIALTTLRSVPSQADRVAETGWQCLVCGEAGVTDVILNLLLFLPLGLTLRAIGWPWLRAVGLAALLTISIETAQATLLTGRDASLSDVLANTLGGAFGWWLLPTLMLLRSPDRTRARSVTAALLVASSACWLMTGWGLRPDGSTSAPWVGQRMRQWSGHDLFPGSLGVATLNGIDVPNDQLSMIPTVPDTLELSLLLMRRDAATPHRPVSILRVVDGQGRQQLSASQRGEELLISSRVRASRLLVRTPTWQFANAMRMPTDVPWLMEWRWMGNRVELQRGPANGSTPPIVQSIPLSIGLGWAFVHPFAAAVGTGTPWWTALWLGLWFLPLGWCLGWLSRWEMSLWGLTAATSFVGASLLTGLPIRPLEFAMVAAWLSLGGISAGVVQLVLRDGKARVPGRSTPRDAA